MSPLIRPELPADHPAIRSVAAAAFGDQNVPALIDLLRASAGYRPDLALVAHDDTGVTGHVMLTGIPLSLASGEDHTILCLSPLSVRPDRQGRGVGRALVEGALRSADGHGAPMVVLEGDPRLYHRFGFVAGIDHGLLRPSPTIPEPAFQVRPLGGYDPGLRGQVGYPVAFWATGSAGLQEPVEDNGPYAVPWLFQFARYAGWIGAAATILDRPVPACPGWVTGDVLRHLGTIYRVVASWIHNGRRPVEVPAGPDGEDVHAWFGQGWRELFEVLAAAPPVTPAAGWSPYDTTIGFWRRRMVHETVIHAHDILATGPDSPVWTVPEAVALDGIDEALRLWLGTRLGDRMAGSGRILRITATGTAEPCFWTVGLHRRFAEVHRLPTPPDTRVEGEPAALYAWLWGRPAQVDRHGDPAAVAELRHALDLCMR